MEVIWAGCPELALENLVCVFGMSQEGRCQVEITVPILSEMEQRQEGPVLLHLHAWPGPGRGGNILAEFRLQDLISCYGGICFSEMLWLSS